MPRRVLLLLPILFASANSTGICRRTGNSTIFCRNVDLGVVERLSVYYKNDVDVVLTNSSISVLKTDIFAKLKRVQRLSLVECGIKVLPEGSLRGLANLTHLNLAKNFISRISRDFFDNLTSLRYLDLSRNVIRRLEFTVGTPKHPTNLVYVDVSNNLLRNLSFSGDFTSLETLNMENNSIAEFQVEEMLRFPKIKRVFVAGNPFNRSYENFVRYVLSCGNIDVDSENWTKFDDGWNVPENKIRRSGGREIRSNDSSGSFDHDFRRLTPEIIKSLNPAQLANLVNRILTLRNFTLTEKRMLEMDRKLVREESRRVKNELTRIEQIRKRVTEVFGKAVDEYAESSCDRIPDDSWWRRFKRWKCNLLQKWIKRITSR